MNDVEDTFRQPGLFQQSGNLNGGERDFFAWFEDEGVSANQSNRIHPQWHHCRKIEWRDADTHAKRLADRVAINPSRDVFNTLTHKKRRDATRELHHFNAASHIASRFNECLAVFAGVAANQVFEILLQQHLEPEKTPRSFGRRCFPPARKSCSSSFDSLIYMSRSAHGGLGDNFARGGIVHG